MQLQEKKKKKKRVPAFVILIDTVITDSSIERLHIPTSSALGHWFPTDLPMEHDTELWIFANLVK